MIIPILAGWQIHRSDGLYLRKRKTAAPITAFFLILAFLLMFRGLSVGSDTMNYRYFFHRIRRLQWNELGEFGLEYAYVLLNKAVSVLTDHEQGLFIVSALLSLIPMYILYKEDWNYAPLKILIFVNLSMFPMLFSGIRQAIAVSVGIIAYFFVRRKQFLWFLVTVVVAFLFHRSAFVLLALYPACHIRLRKKHLWFVVPIIAAIFVFNRQIFALLTLFIGDYFGSVAMTQTGAYTIILLFSLFSIFSFVIPEESMLDDETIGLRNVLLLATCLQFFAPLHTISMRMNYYFIIFIPVLLPRVILCAKQNMKQVAHFANIVMCVFFFAYYFLTAYSGGDTLNLYPYSFFWENR